LVFYYPDLKGRDLSSWTNADFEAYSTRKDDETYAPTAEQADQLQERGISLKMARRLLKEYGAYDKMLAQTDSELSSMQAKYKQADAESENFIKQKEKVRDQYLNTSAR
jgi:hypothetical protein